MYTSNLLFYSNKRECIFCCCDDSWCISADQNYSSTGVRGQRHRGWASRLELFRLWRGVSYRGWVRSLPLPASLLCQGKRNCRPDQRYSTHSLATHAETCIVLPSMKWQIMLSSILCLWVYCMHEIACSVSFNLQFPLVIIKIKETLFWKGVPVPFLKYVLLFITHSSLTFLSPGSLSLNTACQVTVGAGAIHPIPVQCSSYIFPYFPCRCKWPWLSHHY